MLIATGAVGSLRGRPRQLLQQFTDPTLGTQADVDRWAVA